MSSKVLLVQGTSIEISNEAAVDTASTALTFATLDCTSRQVQWQGGTSTETDVTTLCSTAKEFRLGLGDAGTLTVTGHWVQDDDAQKVIKTASVDKKARLIRVTFEDGSKFSSIAFVSQRSWDANVDGVVSGTFAFRLSGEPLEEGAPSGG